MNCLISCLLIVLLAGCIPIGIRAGTQLASAMTAEPASAR